MKKVAAVILAISIFAVDASADSFSTLFDAAKRQNSKLAVGFLAYQKNEVLSAYHSKDLLIPASVQKLYTTYAAVRELGSEFKFETEFFFDPARKALIIKPAADPTFTSEVLLELLRTLDAWGYRRIDEVEILSAPGDSEQSPQGTRAYEAGFAPFVFNFNSFGVRVCAGSERAVVMPFAVPSVLRNSVQIGASSNIELDEGKNNSWEVSGTIERKGDCVEKFKSSRHSCDLFLSELKYLGKAFGLSVSASAVHMRRANSSGGIPMLTIRSKPLRELLITMNQQSSNLFADQLVLALGKRASNAFSYEQGLRRMASLIKDHSIIIEDGSGLSRDNRSSAESLTKILQAMIDNVELRSILEVSLPVYGSSGTLQKRAPLDSSCVVRAKTGTLNNVSSLVGLVYNANRESPIVFAMLQNGTASLHEGREVEDRLLRKLCAGS